MKILSALIFSVFAFSVSAVAQETDSTTHDPYEHKIDQQLTACLDAPDGMHTNGQLACFASAADAWDAELNSIHQKLSGLLSEVEMGKLRTAQRAWIIFRDAEFDFSGEMYNGLQGSMYRVMNAGRRYELIKTRALDLISYHSDLIDR